MPELSIKKLQFETDSWKRRLGFMMDDNILFKNSISDLLKENFKQDLLGEVEEFHGRFLEADEWIGLLRNEIAELDDLLVREIFEDGKIAKELEIKFGEFRDNLLVVQKKLDVLKQDFQKFLASQN
ncbi:MAG: hypothetical protein KGM98_00505 [Bacteroidota bacterium]|nr:hypothetical protein [Bacteroidota bacterium]